MAGLKRSDILGYVEAHIPQFHRRRIESLDNLRLNTVLRRKNPYLFRAKNLLTAEAVVKGLVDAHLSSNEETLFGDWLEKFAIFINERVYGGWKSGIKGVDLEFNKDGCRYVVSIKSGPNWGNSSQIGKMKADFIAAQKTLRTGDAALHVVCVNGCCYGRDSRPDKGGYVKYCGEMFWRFISGEEELYTEIITPLGHQAKQRNEEFMEAYAKRLNVFTMEFGGAYCRRDGAIDWEKLVKFNSSASGRN